MGQRDRNKKWKEIKQTDVVHLFLLMLMVTLWENLFCTSIRVQDNMNSQRCGTTQCKQVCFQLDISHRQGMWLLCFFGVNLRVLCDRDYDRGKYASVCVFVNTRIWLQLQCAQNFSYTLDWLIAVPRGMHGLLHDKLTIFKESQYNLK